jgi:GlpG protein
VFIMSGFGQKLEPVFSLYISGYDARNLTGVSIFQDLHERLAHFGDLLPEIRHGQLWRLFTPIFVHGDFLHIFFNMWCLRDFGSMVEDRQGSWLFVVLVAAFAAISNFAQFMLHGPIFLGMSGVVYGLLGYIWIRGKFDPGSGLYLHPSTVTIMIVWFFVCLIDIVHGIANTAHAAGLIAGMAWGYLSSLRYR